jgi:hypothetical protein
LRVRVALVSDVNPIDIGVAAATQDVLDGDRTPEYQPRDVDALIDEAVLNAVTARGDWIVVVEGDSTVGKSRTLFEALRRCEEAGHPLKLVAPAKGEDLRLLLATGYKAFGRHKPTVLWLDDLERFLTSVTFGDLDRWRTAGECRIVAATFGGKGSAKMSEELATTADDILQRASEIRLHVDE